MVRFAMLALVLVVGPMYASCEGANQNEAAKAKLLAKERHRFEFPSRDSPAYWLPLRFSPDGSLLASPGEVGTILIWDLGTGKQKTRLDCGKDYSASTLLFSPDGAILIAKVRTKNDSLVKAWDIINRRELFTIGIAGDLVGFEQKDKEVICLEPLGLFAGASIQYRSLKDGSVRHQIELPHPAGKFFSGFTLDGKLYAQQFLGRDRVAWITIRELATGKEVKLQDVQPAVIDFSLSGRLLVCSDVQEETIRIWKSDSGEMIQKIKPLIGRGPVAISADDKWVASGVFNKGRQVIIYDVASGKELGEFEVLRGTPKARQAFGLAFSPKGNLLASSHAGAVQVWELTVK